MAHVTVEYFVSEMFFGVQNQGLLITKHLPALTARVDLRFRLFPTHMYVHVVLQVGFLSERATANGTNKRSLA